MLDLLLLHLHKQLPDTRWGERQRGWLNTQRVGDSVGEGSSNTHRIAFTQSFRAQWRQRRGRLDMGNTWHRHLGHGRAQIVGKGTIEELTIFVVEKFLEERNPQPVSQPTQNLPMCQQGIEQATGVVNGHIVEDRDLSRLHVNSDLDDIDEEAIGGRGVDTILLIGWRNGIKAVIAGFKDAWGHMGGELRRIPVCQTGQPPQREGGFPLTMIDASMAEGQFMLRHMELLRRQTKKFLFDLHCGGVYGAGAERGKAAGIAAGSNRPGTGSGIHFSDDAHATRFDRQHVCYNLLDSRLVALSLRCAIDTYCNTTQRVDSDRRGGGTTRFR